MKLDGYFSRTARAAALAGMVAGVAMTAASAAAAPMPEAQMAQAGALKPGEYACYGSGGRILIGLGFKALAGGRYTDLDGKSPGTFTVSGDTIVFKGGHLDGQIGRDLRNNTFRINSVGCEPG